MSTDNPPLTELAAPVLLMAEAFVQHQVSAGRFAEANENVAALVAFRRALKETEVPALTAEPYRHALEQRLIGSNLPGLTGDADADLMRFVFHEQEIAGYFCGQLEKDLAAERAARVAAEGERDQLIDEWCEALGYQPDDKTFMHCLLHIKNTVSNRRADMAVAVAERDTLRTQLAEAQAELARLGPVEYQAKSETSYWMPTLRPEKQLSVGNKVQAIRRVLSAKESPNAQ